MSGNGNKESGLTLPVDETIDTITPDDEVELMLETRFPSPIKPPGVSDEKFKMILKIHRDTRKLHFISQMQMKKVEKAFNTFMPHFLEVQEYHSEMQKQVVVLMESVNTMNAEKQKQDEHMDFFMKFSEETRRIQEGRKLTMKEITENLMKK